MTITCNELQNLKDCTIIDVRSEKEFNESHIPGAINCPLLDNLERHTIGLLYKEQGRDKALKEGFNVLIKKFDEFCSEIIKNRSKNVIIYCARGGMRSEIVVDIFNKKQKLLQLAKEVHSDVNLKRFEEKLNSLQHVKTIKLTGGYKAYRNYLLEKFNNFNYNFTFIVFYGLAGAGKTDILKQLEKEGYPVIDLEELAQHRSSIFGGVGMQPRSQKMFEALLLEKLEQFKNKKYVFVEGEARRIGDRIIPKEVFKRMNKGIKIFVEADIDDRINRIIQYYFNTTKKAQQMEEIIPQLKQFIGKKKVEELLTLMKEKNYPSVTKILLDYYDERYMHGFKRMHFDRIITNKEIKLIIRDFIN